MRRTLTLLMVVALVVMPFASLSAQTRAAKALDIYYIDTEGGQATLFVSPSGQTLLVDTGNAGERDLNRILDVLNTAGVKQIDHLVLTHYHGDHYGSMAEIVKRIPVAHFYDHGPSIEGDRPNIAAFQKLYPEIIGKSQRTIVKPGDKIAFAGTDVTVVTSDTNVLKTPIAKAPGAGRPNPACASFKERDESKVDPDNHHSVGFVLTYGKFRMLDLGDFTWNREFQLMCPNNPIGTIDLYLTSHHGLDQSGSPALVHGLQPRVAIMNNGTRKGGAVQSFQTLESSPGLEDLWQLHWSYAGGVEHNAPGVKIANIDEPAQIAAIVTGATTPAPPAGPGGNAAHSPAHYIKVVANTDGSFTVTNSRNGYTKTYAAR
jgi:competence protein ComEC